MSKNIKIIICGCIVAMVVSLLYAIVPITDTFIVSHIFSIIAIFLIVCSLCTYKGRTKAVAGLSYIYSFVLYAVVSIIFSIIACIISLAVVWTLVIHIIILAIFTIRVIVSNAGSDYISNVDGSSTTKHNEFIKEKNNYWK